MTPNECRTAATQVTGATRGKDCAGSVGSGPGGRASGPAPARRPGCAGGCNALSGRDAMHHEMPGFFPGRPGGEHDEPLLDMILERCPIPRGAARDSWSRADARRRSRVGRTRGPARTGRCACGLQPARAPRHLASAPAPTRDFTQHGPTVTSSPTHKQPELSPPAPGKIYSAASADPVSDRTGPGPFRHHLRRGNGAAPGYYRCVPAPAFEQGPAVGRSRNPVSAGLRCRRPGRTESSR